MSKTEIEVFIAMNEKGDYCVFPDDVTARDMLDADYGGCACRIVKLKVAMTPPVYEEPAASVDVPDSDLAIAAEAR